MKYNGKEALEDLAANFRIAHRQDVNEEDLKNLIGKRIRAKCILESPLRTYGFEGIVVGYEKQVICDSNGEAFTWRFITEAGISSPILNGMAWEVIADEGVWQERN